MYVSIITKYVSSVVKKQLFNPLEFTILANFSAIVNMIIVGKTVIRPVYISRILNLIKRLKLIVYIRLVITIVSEVFGLYNIRTLLSRYELRLLAKNTIAIVIVPTEIPKIRKQSVITIGRYTPIVDRPIICFKKLIQKQIRGISNRS